MANVPLKNPLKPEVPQRKNKLPPALVAILTIILVLNIVLVALFVSGPRIVGFFAAGQSETFEQDLNIIANESIGYNWELPAGADKFLLTSVSLSGSIIGDGTANVWLVTASGDRLHIYSSEQTGFTVSPLTGFSAAELPEQAPESPGQSEDTPAADNVPEQAPPSQEEPVPEEPAAPEEPAPAEETPPAEEQPPAEEVPTEPSEGNVTEPEQPPSEEIPPEEVPSIEFTNECIETCAISQALTQQSYTLAVEVTPGVTLAIDTITFGLLAPEENLANETLPLIENITNITNDTVFFETTIKDAENNTVPAIIEFVDPETEKLKAVGKSEHGDREITEQEIEEFEAGKKEKTEEAQAPAETQPSENLTSPEELPTEPAAEPAFSITGAAVLDTTTVDESGVLWEASDAPGLEVPKGDYKIKVKLQNAPIQEIVFSDLQLESNVVDFIKVDDSPEAGTGFRELYAIDPAGFNFTSATVTAVAKGTQLRKCKEWDFANQTCLGEWTFVMAIAPGKQYSFILTPEDPGFGDSSPDIGTPDAGEYLPFGDGFSSTVNTFTATQTDDASYFAIRRTNGGGANLDLQANLTLAYNLTNLTSIQGATTEKIQNLTFKIEHCYNDDITGGFACGGGAPGGTIENPLPVFLFNWTSNSFVQIGTYTGSSISEANATVNVTSGFSDFIHPTTGFVNISWTVNVVITVNGNDAAFGVDIAPLTVVFDVVRPTVTNVNPPQNSNFTQNDIVQINATVTDDVAVSTVGANVTLPNGTIEVLPLPLITGSIYGNNFTNTVLGGRYNVTIIANDTSNNVNSTETTFFNVNVPDSQVPTIEFVSPTPANNTLQNSTSVTINATVTDNVAVDTCVLEFDFTNSTMNKTGSGATVVCDSTVLSLSDGTHFYSIFANDSSNNGNSTITRTLRVDATAPQVQFVAPTEANGSTLTQNYIQVNVTASDANFANVTTRLFNSSGLVLEIVNTTTTAFNNFTVLPAGTYFFNATAVDLAGNANATETRTVTLAAPDATAPVVTLIAPTPANNSFISISSATINASVTDTESSIDVCFLQLDGTNTTMNETGSGLSIICDSTQISLGEGLHNFTVFANDSAGNTGSNGTNFFTVDTISPQVQFVAPTTAAGNFTQNYIEANVTATDTNLGTITLFLYNSTSIVQTNTSGSSPLFVNFTSLADGTYFLNATANDSAGNTNQTETRTIILDNAAPQVQFVAPTETSGTFQSRDYIQTNVTVTDTNFKNVTIRLFNSTGLVSSITNSTTTAFNNFTGLADGTYFFNATAFDHSGNSNSTETRNVTIDTTSPQVQFVSPTEANGSTLARPYIQVNVTATDTNFANITTRLFNSTEIIMTVTNSTTTAFNNFTGLISGVYQFNASATDLAGNTNITETRIIVIDITGPTITFIAPTPANNTLQNSTSVTINTSVTNGIAVDSCILELDGVNSSMTRIGSGISVTCNSTVSGLSDGTHVYKVYANDTANNFNESETRHVRIDATAPQVQLVSPTETSGSYISRNYILTNVSATDSNFANITTRLFNSTGLARNITNATTTAFNNFTSLADGFYEFNATAADLAENQNSTETRNVTIDTVKPLIAFVAPTPANNSVVNGTQIINVTATDANLVNITIFNETSAVISCLTSACNFTWDTTAYTNGLHYFNATAIDRAGNVNSTETRTFNVSNADNVAPSVILVSPSAGTSFMINDTVSISANVTDANSSISAVIANVTLPNGTVVIVDLSSIGAPSYAANFTELSLKGSYNITFRANDSAGNVNSSVMTNFTRVTADGTNRVDITNVNSTLVTATITTIGNVSGLLDLNISLVGFTISSIIVNGYNQSDPKSTIRYENDTADTGFRRTYLLDLSGLNASSVNFTATAVAPYLYQCTEFNTTTLACTGGWEEVFTSLTAGQIYTVTLNQTDPGFGDSSPDEGTPDNGTYVAVDDGFDSTVNTFVSTQANDGAYFAVRRNNGGGAQLDLEAFLELDYNLTNLTASPSDITSMNFSLEHCFNDDIAGPFTCGGGAPGGTIENPLAIQLFNWTSGSFVSVGNYTGSSVTEGNATANVTSGFAHFVNSTTNVTRIRYTVNVTIVTNGNDAAFGVDYAPLVVSFDLENPRVTNVTAFPSTIQTNEVTNITANVTDDNIVSSVVANITISNGTVEQRAMSLLSGNLYRASFNATAGYPLGFYNVTIVATDAVGKVNNTERTNFTVADNAFPIITFVSPTPANGTVQASTNVTINVTVTDNLAVSTCILEFDSVNETMTKIGSGTSVSCNTTKTGLSDGTHTYKVYANDTAGNMNVSETRVVTVDTTNPIVTYVAPTPADNAFTNINFIFVNVTAVNSASSIDTCFLDFNGTNSTMTKVGSGVSVSCNKNNTGLADSVYTFKAYANDTLGNTGSAATRTVTVDTVKPVITNISTSSVTSSSAVANWITNEAANSSVNFGTNETLLGTTAGSSSFVTTHAVTLSSLSAATTYFFNITSCDQAGNCNTTTGGNFTTTAAAAAPPAAGAPSGAAAPIAKPLERLVLPSIGTIVTIEDKMLIELLDDIDIREIFIDVRDAVTTQIKVSELIGAPVTIPRLTGADYKYWEIATDLEDANIQAAVISFRVQRSWIVKNNVDSGSIIMYRYADGWDGLQTTYVSQDSLYYYYEAETEGFSVFGVNGSAELPVLRPPALPEVEVLFEIPLNYLLAAAAFVVLLIFIIARRKEIGEIGIVAEHKILKEVAPARTYLRTWRKERSAAREEMRHAAAAYFEAWRKERRESAKETEQNAAALARKLAAEREYFARSLRATKRRIGKRLDEGVTYYKDFYGPQIDDLKQDLKQRLEARRAAYEEVRRRRLAAIEKKRRELEEKSKHYLESELIHQEVEREAAAKQRRTEERRRKESERRRREIAEKIAAEEAAIAARLKSEKRHYVKAYKDAATAVAARAKSEKRHYVKAYNDVAGALTKKWRATKKYYKDFYGPQIDDLKQKLAEKRERANEERMRQLRKYETEKRAIRRREWEEAHLAREEEAALERQRAKPLEKAKVKRKEFRVMWRELIKKSREEHKLHKGHLHKKERKKRVPLKDSAKKVAKKIAHFRLKKLY